MSLHRSLKTKPSGLNQHRNVLTRAERIQKLSEKSAFDAESDSPIGLVKVANRMAAARKKKTEKAEGAEGEAAAATAAAPGADAKKTEAKKTEAKK